MVKENNIPSKVVKSLFLNIIGFQAFRYLLYKIIRKLKKIFYKYEISNDYNNKGYLMINNFIEDNSFKKIILEFESILNENFIKDSFKNKKNENSQIRAYYYNFIPNEYLKKK